MIKIKKLERKIKNHSPSYNQVNHSSELLFSIIK